MPELCSGHSVFLRDDELFTSANHVDGNADFQVFPNLFGGIDGSFERDCQGQAGAVTEGEAVFLGLRDEVAGDSCLLAGVRLGCRYQR